MRSNQGPIFLQCREFVTLVISQNSCRFFFQYSMVLHSKILFPDWSKFKIFCKNYERVQKMTIKKHHIKCLPIKVFFSKRFQHAKKLKWTRFKWVEKNLLAVSLLVSVSIAISVPVLYTVAL